ncbi:AAA family ATPase [Mesorhizobium salmacidum]|uniref:AAA family ATPase n=1 Tax=Mesorhizobium salmacidum TaxID=3015171 RepID=A0ABU8L4Y7_9HYPH
MNGFPLLHEIELTNFRSIRGRVQTPLDAKMVLVHGENGAGKTSLLTAIEVALTGRAIALQRADPAYAKQLIYRHADNGNYRHADTGNIALTTTGLTGSNQFSASFDSEGITARSLLSPSLSGFFSERCYLPQSMLGQLLQIYQESDSTPNSPLARFVTELLGLDRLDAIESGLAPVDDLRNMRKTSRLFVPTESEKQRYERSLAEYQSSRALAQRDLTEALAAVNEAWAALELDGKVSEKELPTLDYPREAKDDEDELSELFVHRRNLEFIRSSLAGNSDNAVAATEATLVAEQRGAGEALAKWASEYQTRITDLEERVAKLLPDISSAAAQVESWHVEASRRLAEDLRQTRERVVRMLADANRKAALMSELDVGRKNLKTLDDEIGLIGSNADRLAEILSSINAVIVDDYCPVCDRNFAETAQGALIDHVHRKVSRLSGSAERLLGLSRNRSAQQELIESLIREQAEIDARSGATGQLSTLARREAELESVVSELASLAEPIATYARISAQEARARRAIGILQNQGSSRTTALEQLGEITRVFNLEIPGQLQASDGMLASLEGEVAARIARVTQRSNSRRKLVDSEKQAKLLLDRKNELDQHIAQDTDMVAKMAASLRRATKIRTDAQTIREQVESVRAAIIRREFNDRLNRLWRDLFVRLAPNEPFVPAFQIPTQSTSQLKPRLITRHRSGGAGGTPGAMLSSGNLNTAALTLFLSLHLTVAPQLPWLVLDDPIQSMDDVHIAHFAALLRTLSKEHHRQIVVAVHDRQLFEYLRLELSPAFADDSLLTVELSRSGSRDTHLFSKRYHHQEETALVHAA